MKQIETDADTEPLAIGDKPEPPARTRFRGIRMASALLVLALVAAACGSDGTDDTVTDDTATDDTATDEAAGADDEMSDDEMSDDESMSETMNDLMSQISSRSDLSVLDTAIHAADLQDTLHDEGPFTIFAPSDAAFEAYFGEMSMSAEDAVADTEALTTLLLAHIVSGTSNSAVVAGLDGQTMESLAGGQLDISVDGETVMVGDATVIEVDLTADNGVIHVIDTVLTPPAG